MVIQVDWTEEALRAFTRWLATYSRDGVNLRAARKFHLRLIEKELRRTNGYPEGCERVVDATGESIGWEYATGVMWLVLRRGVRRANFFQRLLGRTDVEVLIVTAIRHPPTPQELRSLPR